MDQRIGADGRSAQGFPIRLRFLGGGSGKFGRSGIERVQLVNPSLQLVKGREKTGGDLIGGIESRGRKALAFTYHTAMLGLRAR